MRAFWLSCAAVVVSAVVIVTLTHRARLNAEAEAAATVAEAPRNLPFAESSSGTASADGSSGVVAVTIEPEPLDSIAIHRVLFIGNSYTLSNDMPGTLGVIAQANGFAIDIGVEAKWGFALADHLARSHALEMLHNQDWDTVVIQELSTAPAQAEVFDSLTKPAVATFAEAASSIGTDVMFFQTWGHRAGSEDAGQPGYGPMQRAIIDSYAELAATHNGQVAEVGAAWGATMATLPELNLYVEDGSHPSAAGSYLAALVIARALSQVDLAVAPAVGVPEHVANDLLEIVNSTTPASTS